MWSHWNSLNKQNYSLNADDSAAISLSSLRLQLQEVKGGVRSGLGHAGAQRGVHAAVVVRWQAEEAEPHSVDCTLAWSGLLLRHHHR